MASYLRHNESFDAPQHDEDEFNREHAYGERLDAHDPEVLRLLRDTAHRVAFGALKWYCQHADRAEARDWIVGRFVESPPLYNKAKLALPNFIAMFVRYRLSDWKKSFARKHLSRGSVLIPDDHRDIKLGNDFSTNVDARIDVLSSGGGTSATAETVIMEGGNKADAARAVNRPYSTVDSYFKGKRRYLQAYVNPD